ncbi:MAG: methyl-accepting chemotaxis protein [Rubrivivax sp.]|nr:methyl-accepting chemotaxis protein [Rubrivivax sp.]
MALRNLKIWIQLLLTIGAALVLVWVAVIAWEGRGNREAAIAQAAAFSASMHEATMAGLTGMMVTGTVAQRAVFLDQLRELNAIRDLRVLRGDAVSRVFGPGAVAGQAPPDELEKQVLATGKEVVRVEQDAKGEVLRAVRPTLALKNYLGKDCLTCHVVPEGTVLGVVSMKMSLEATNRALADMRAQSLIAALVTCIPVLLLIYPFIQKVVTRPLEKGVRLANGIARGDLRQSIDVETTNETGQLHAALKAMSGSLVGIVARVRQGSNAIAAASGEIAAGNADLSSRTEMQAAALHEALSRTSALTESARRNAEGARQADELARAAADVAVRGGEAVSRVVGSMDAIHETSRRIADITSVIDGIAFRTNILALNASVEAARAGEQGRGFAVVAEEVRHLATRSAGAAREIKALVEASVSEIDTGTRLAHEAGSTMKNVVQGVVQVNALVDAITQASRQQIQGVEQVNAAIAQIEGATQQNAALVEQAAAATMSLKAQAVDLDRTVGVFQLDEAAEPA